MYCQNCGNKINKNLNYCNSCGVKLVKAEEPENQTIANSLSVALGYIGFIGFFTFAGLIAIMLGKDIEPQVVVMIAIAYLAALFGVCALILKQISNQTAIQKNRDQPQRQAHETSELEMPKSALQIEEARQPFVSSVTDHTTRTLEEISLKEK